MLLDVREALGELLIERPLQRFDVEASGVTFPLALVQGRFGPLPSFAGGEPVGEGAGVLFGRPLHAFLRALRLLVGLLKPDTQLVKLVVQLREVAPAAGLRARRPSRTLPLGELEPCAVGIGGKRSGATRVLPVERDLLTQLLTRHLNSIQPCVPAGAHAAPALRANAGDRGARCAGEDALTRSELFEGGRRERVAHKLVI